MAPAVVKMVAMPDAFEDSSKPPTTAPRSPANLLFPRAEPYRPPKAAQDAHINLLTYTREPPTRPFMSTGLAPTELDRHIRSTDALTRGRITKVEIRMVLSSMEMANIERVMKKVSAELQLQEATDDMAVDDFKKWLLSSPYYLQIWSQQHNDKGDDFADNPPLSIVW